MIVNPEEFYSGFSTDYTNKSFEVFLEPTEETLFSVWEEKFKNFDNVNVCLSGGIDSQFLMYVLSTLKKNIKIYIFSWIWDDCVFNSPDVLHAIRFCKKYGYEYTNIEIDYKSFLETGKCLEVCKQYRAESPQIAMQLYMLGFIDNNNPIFLGSDTPLIQYDFANQTCSVTGLNYQVYTTTAFLNYAKINKKIVIKDLFKTSPKTQYLSYKSFIDITKDNKLVYPKTNSPVSNYSLRLLTYNSLGATDYLMKPLLKNSGFEILKMHLAKDSGVYNQYDILYRFPIIGLLKHEDWYTDASKFKIKFKHSIMADILKEYEDFCKTTSDLNKVEIYNFIL